MRQSPLVGCLLLLLLLASSCTREEPAEREPPRTDSVAEAPPTGTVEAPGDVTRTDVAFEEQRANDAVAVIREYYRAISARDFDEAYRKWGESGPPGQNFDQFVAGFADTASSHVETGEPSRIEPAAGSRYVEVPVTIRATKRDGSTQRFEGMYMLRRSVVDGATQAQREWHIYRASIREVR